MLRSTWIYCSTVFGSGWSKMETSIVNTFDRIKLSSLARALGLRTPRVRGRRDVRHSGLTRDMTHNTAELTAVLVCCNDLRESLWQRVCFNWDRHERPYLNSKCLYYDSILFIRKSSNSVRWSKRYSCKTVNNLAKLQDILWEFHLYVDQVQLKQYQTQNEKSR